MHRICQIVLLIAMIFASCGCIPFYGNANPSVSTDPVRFVDAASGRTVSEVLVIPRYTSGSGISVMSAGHGPSSDASPDLYIAHPFRYHEGDKFTPAQPKTFALFVLGVVWIPSRTTLDGVVIVAPGYDPRWVDDFYGDRRCWQLSPLGAPSRFQQLARLRDSLSRDKLDRTEDFRLWSYGDKMDVRFSSSERQNVLAFLDEASARLRASNPAGK